jgi:hypothetical protein
MVAAARHPNQNQEGWQIGAKAKRLAVLISDPTISGPILVSLRLPRSIPQRLEDRARTSVAASCQMVS